MGEHRARPRTVVITGASSGVGNAAALAFAAAGDRLVLAARSRPALDAVARECRAAGAAVRVVTADVTRPETLDEVAAAAVAESGGIDVWVHTAAVMVYGRFEDVPAEIFDRVVQTDLVGAAAVARTALVRFRAQRHGVLVIAGSLLGSIVAPYMSAYVASKWGVRGLVRALRQETRDAPGIHVCLVAPGAINTPIYRNAANFAGRAGRPPPPVDPPEKVARAILRCAARPRAMVTVGGADLVTRVAFTALPGLYDLLVGPLMRAGGLSRDPVAPHPGNVLAPLPPSAHTVHGSWGRRRLLRPVGAVCALGAAALTGAAIRRFGGRRPARSR
ncbi:SDR family NAD(P)-dependent oxidoreductase [Dactylosporangium sp. NPDC050688]|uniref:SDR family NAD(P)-dependent oxidoreductase n=1 Tax=Dactylosporangium sp. NPDC050688 TaxID=3157217 RepID=UPI0034053AB5